MKPSVLLKRSAVGLMAAALCLACTACGSSAGTHLSSYFSRVGDIVSDLASGGSVPGGTSTSATGTSDSSSDAVQLATPANFTVDAEGNYSFDGVENASFYLIYFCEPTATEDGDDYLFASSPIYDDGSATYAGSCSDLFQFSYGEFLVKVFAFPELTDATLSMSSAATADYVFTGAQSDPVLDYFWNTNDSTLELVLTNVGDYTYEAYPDQVEVTFTNTADPADPVTATLEGVSAENYTLTVDSLTKGATYQVTALSRSSSEYVTNPETGTVTVAEALTLGEVNILSDGYTWSDGWATFPRLTEAFSLSSGGSAGTMTGKQGEMSAEIEATPAAAASGASYSYTIAVDFGGFSLAGTLDLMADGTMTFTENGGGPISAGSITGSWVDNGDGTATLSYSPADIKS